MKKQFLLTALLLSATVTTQPFTPTEFIDGTLSFGGKVLSFCGRLYGLSVSSIVGYAMAKDITAKQTRPVRLLPFLTKKNFGQETVKKNTRLALGAGSTTLGILAVAAGKNFNLKWNDWKLAPLCTVGILAGIAHECFTTPPANEDDQEDQS